MTLTCLPQSLPCSTCHRDVVTTPGETSPGIHTPDGQAWRGTGALPICSGSDLTAEDRSVLAEHPGWYFTGTVAA